jgi:drug/metabolite transporter (DMT)-like permease
VHRLGLIRCSLAAVLFGISAPAASRLSGDIGAFTLAGLLYLGAALAVLPVVHRTPLTRRSLRRGAPRLVATVVVGGAIGPVLLMAGLASTTAASASLLLNLELVFTTVLAYFVFREHVGGRVVAGTALVVVAGVLLGWSGDADLRWGALLIAGACLCWGIDNCITATLDELAPSHITLAKGVVAGGANLAIGLVIEGGAAVGPMLLALVVGGFGYGLSITLWVAGARDLGAARGQLVFATAPFVGAVVAWTVFTEPVVTREVVSLLVAAAGVAFVLRSSHEHEHTHDEIEHEHEHTHDDGHHDHDHEDGRVASASDRHQHRHHHAPMQHSHPHVPDLHHRHDHSHV